MGTQISKITKVFISSTWIDLKKYREVAIHVCRRIGLTPIPMEEFGPDTREPLEVCLAKVDEAELYLGIFAHRYGYIPDGFDCSITELEYERAIANGIPVALFVIDEDFPWTPRYIDEGEAKKKLAAFKNRIGSKHTYQKFGDLDKFKEDLFVYLPRLVALDKSPAESLHFVSPIPEPPEAYIAHPYTLLQVKGLIGRQKELNWLTDWIAKPERFGHARILNVVAIGGMGKSALTWHWFNEIAPQEMKPLAGRLWWSFYESDARFENFITRALAYVSRRSIEQVKEITLPERMSQLLTILDREPHLLVLDGLERILIAYARMDAAYLQDTDIDDKMANFVVGALGLPESAGQSFVGRHQLRKTADVRAGQFLRKLARVRASRILVSTRLYPADIQAPLGNPLPRCFAVFLPGLSDQDALDLWRAYGAKGSREVMLPVFETFDKHPLLIQVLASHVATFKSDPGNFDAWRAANPDFNVFGLPLANVQSHVLAYALRGLTPAERRTLFVIAAFRLPANMDTIKALLIRADEEDAPAKKPFTTLAELDAALTDLEDRGLLGWNKRANRYELHPIVRGVVWSSLDDDARTDIYGTLHVHFEAMPMMQFDDVESFEDLTPAIELYNALIELGRYQDAYRVFRVRLSDATLYRLSAGRLRVEMLEQLFPDGLGALPQLSDSSGQSWTLNALATGYLISGRPGDAVITYRRACDLCVEEGDQPNLSVDLCNLSDALRLSGSLRAAEASTRAALIIAREEDYSYSHGMSLYLLGLALAARGVPGEAEEALQRSMQIWVAQSHKQFEGLVNAYLAERSLWMGQVTAAQPLADRAWELAAVERYERDSTRTARLQGTAALHLGDFDIADERLHHALTRARAVNLVEEELPILIALAEWHRRRGEAERAREMLDDVWESAERGPYPLFHADALNVLAQIERDAGDTDAAVEAATEAYRKAWCDGPPFAYHWGLEKAKAHLAALDAPEPKMPPFDESQHEPMPEVEINPPDVFGGAE